MGLGKLGEFTTPTGVKGDVTNPKDWLGLVIGAVIFFGIIGVGQYLLGVIRSKVPAVAKATPGTGNSSPGYNVI